MRRLTSKRQSEQGDTIIEVIFAIVIFAFVAISSLAIMNQGVATGEKALEITLVRQEVNAQAEALRYIHEMRVVNPSSDHAADWEKFTTSIDEGGYGRAEATSYGVSGGECKVPADSFILNALTARVWSSAPSDTALAGNGNYPPYSQVKYDGNAIEAAYGIWIEAVDSELSGRDTQKPYVDFHIRACWPAPGSDIPMTIGTIVRLYDPV